jgi:hypothetical protein
LPKRGAECLAEIDMGDLFRRQRVHQPELVDKDGHRARLLADSEMVEAMEGVRSELDAAADLAERRRLFENERVEAFPRETKRGGESADAPRL